MEYVMRRKERGLDLAQAERILREGEYGVLSTIGADGKPYGVPVSYVYSDNAIYFHCAAEGRKLDNLRGCGWVSFCVVGKTELLPAQFSTKYESVIAEGRARELEGEEKTAALTLLVGRLAPAYAEKGAQYIQAAQGKARAFCIEPERISGKGRK